MGSASSKPLNKVTIGRSNRAASSIYMQYNIEDKSQSIYAKQEEKDAYDIFLDIRLNKVYEILKNRLTNIKTLKHYISPDKQHRYNIIYNPVDLAIKAVSKGYRLEDIIYDYQEHGNHLTFCKEDIFELSENIGQLNQVQYLQLCCNYITRIPTSIQCLQKLKSLVLYKNQLRSLPDEICQLKNLLVLDVSFNFLIDLPRNISCLSQLHTLNIENNNLENIPEQISKLKSLKILNISNNLNKDIPLQILRMPFLMELTAQTKTFVFSEEFKKIGELGLKELCSRHLIRKNLKIYKNIDRPLIKHLLNVEECGFCGGPLFDSYYSVKTTQVFENSKYPITYKICTKHYKQHKKRIEVLFTQNHRSLPYELLLKHNMNVASIFDPIVDIKTETYFPISSSNKIKLSSLSKWNTYSLRNKLFRNLDYIFFE